MKRYFAAMAVILWFAGSLSAGLPNHKKVKITKVKTPTAQKKAPSADSAEPDKVLYMRAMQDVQHKKFTEARLDFQTLINTYPDSEYLAKAKLGVADSFYKEGGTSNLTQAVEEYKNFIVFFPFLDEAAYAQMQVGMAHYRMMEKADRDNSQAEAADQEFRTFLEKYPQNPLVPKAEQYLRNVQEVLADGEFRVARFYYLKQDLRASAARLVEVSDRYPLYSQSDDALFMLGSIYSRAKQVSKNEDDKNHWADLAAKCYERIVRDYPLSDTAPEAKARLKLMGMAVPAADPAAMARMHKERLYAKEHHPNRILKLPLAVIKSNPDVSAAAHSGQPDLKPPDDLISATEVLNQGAAGPSFSVVGAAVSAPSGSGGDAGGGSSNSVETETVTSSDDSAVDPQPATGAAATTPSATSSDPATTDSTSANATSQTPATDASKSDTKTTAPPSDPQSESTSKKKKGFHKMVPW
ncbi:MAG TPA: outer membrane protein assembly factor BamD [Candidatus Acidoferrales bacterium]|nr:outer membrane protein assembly factor BamD [Candidatus Acidoferrales bacterium]